MSKIKNPSQFEALQESLHSTSTASTTVINIDSPKRSQKPRFLGRQSSFGLSPQNNIVSGGFGSNSWTKAYMWVWSGSRYSGVACMLVSSAAYSLMGLFVKLLAVTGVPSSEIVMFRCTVIAILAGAGLRKMGHPLLGTPKVRLLVMARAVIGYFALSTYFYSIQLLPLRDATVLNFTMPIFTAILAAVLLHEKWGVREAAGTLFSFLGVLFVSQPEFIFQGGTVKISTSSTYMGMLAALFGSSLVLFRTSSCELWVKGVNHHWFVFLCLLLCLCLYHQSPHCSRSKVALQGYKIPTLLEACGLLMVGLTAYIAQIFLTRGLQLENAARATSLQYLKVLCTYLLGVAFLSETPSVTSFFGALLIAGSSFSLSIRPKS